MDGVPEALDSDKLYAGHEQRSSRSWRSSRQASSEALAAIGAWGRQSSRPAIREAQRPGKLAASEQGDACGRRSLSPGKLAAGEQGGAATGQARNLRAGRRGGRRSSRPASRGTQRSECAVYKQGSATVGEPGSAEVAAWSPAAGGRRGRERGRDHMGGGMASSEAPAKMANGFSGMQNEKPSA